MIVSVRMADWKMAKSPDSLKTSGLGSCVAVVIYDPLRKVAAMAHVMLPSSEAFIDAVAQKGKYADTAISDMVHTLCHSGTDPTHLMAKIAGGAQMFGFKSQRGTFSIGTRNVEACIQVLSDFRIPIVMRDTGGHARTNGRIFL